MTRFVLFLIGVALSVGGFLPLWILTLWAQPTSLLAVIHGVAGSAMLGGVIASALGALFIPEHYVR